jgi:DNA-binding FadR family transcriptional regulator
MPELPTPPIKRKAVDEAVDRIRAGILSGEYQAGHDLPGERELSTTLGVSRLTLRAALSRLEAEGLVKPVHGSGTRVLDYREHGGVEMLGHMATLVQRGGEVPLALLADLLELRRAVAVEVMGIAAERITEAELDDLAKHIAYQAKCTGDAQKYMAADIETARRLAQATHNQAILLLSNTIVRVLVQQRGMEFTFLIDVERAISTYKKMVGLLRAGDPRIARKTTRRLLARLDRRLLERIAELVGVPAPPVPSGEGAVRAEGRARARRSAVLTKVANVANDAPSAGGGSDEDPEARS